MCPASCDTCPPPVPVADPVFTDFPSSKCIDNKYYYSRGGVVVCELAIGWVGMMNAADSCVLMMRFKRTALFLVDFAVTMTISSSLMSTKENRKSAGGYQRNKFARINIVIK